MLLSFLLKPSVRPLFAYVDPGGGTFLIQMMLAGTVGLLFQVRKSLREWLQRTVTFLRSGPGAVALMLLGVVAVSYAIPTFLEATLLRRVGPLAILLAGDLVGCVLLAWYFWGFRRASLLYAGLTGCELLIFSLHMFSTRGMLMFENSIPTVVLCACVLTRDL